MLIQGIINPNLNSLLSRIRHTNALVISDAAFPYWPTLETVDIALVKGIPTIPQVLDAIRPNFLFGEVYMASEFLKHNTEEHQKTFAQGCGSVTIRFEPHLEFKKRVPGAIGLIRTGDVTPYGNMILISA